MQMEPQGLPPQVRREVAAELTDELEDPRAEGAEAPELLISAAMFPKGCKEGDTYTVTGTVGKMGSKVSFTPTGAFKPAMAQETAE